MLRMDGGFFVQIPNGSKRILHPATIVGTEDETHTAELEDTDLPVADGQDILIFYEKKREFMQQPACIRRVTHDPKLVIEFETTGEPVSAESRQYYRVSAVMTGLTASLGSENACPLLDVSRTGFSVVARQSYDLGSFVNAALRHENHQYRDRVCVQSIRELSRGRIRYGLHCVNKNRHAGGTPKGLHQISVSLEREQLRRVAGTG